MSKTCIVIGCSGQDGALLCKSLLKSGQKVIGISREDISKPENHKKIGIAGQIPIYSVSLQNSQDILAFLKKVQPEHIYNFSAQSSVGLSFEHPKETQRSIVNATSNLLEACRNTNYEGKIFFSGSSEIYGDTPKPAHLESTINIKSPYAGAKYQSLILARLYKEVYGIKAITGIFFNHESFLRNKNFVTQKIILGAIECTKNKNKKVRLGNIEIARDWGCAEEFMEGVQIIMNSNKIEDQIVCTGKLTSLKKFIEITFDLLGLDWRSHIISDKKLFRRSDIKVSYGDPKKLEEDLGWKPKIDLKTTIKNLIDCNLKSY